MTEEQFIALCKVAKPINIECNSRFRMVITFDNGIVVDVDTENDYDLTMFQFESNIDKENRRLEYIEHKKNEDAKRATIEKAEQLIQSRLTYDELKEVEVLFKK